MLRQLGLELLVPLYSAGHCTFNLSPPSLPRQVSDGELRQPGPDIMRKLSGAKDKLG